MFLFKRKFFFFGYYHLVFKQNMFCLNTKATSNGTHFYPPPRGAEEILKIKKNIKNISSAPHPLLPIIFIYISPFGFPISFSFYSFGQKKNIFSGYLSKKKKDKHTESAKKRKHFLSRLRISLHMFRSKYFSLFFFPNCFSGGENEGAGERIRSFVRKKAIWGKEIFDFFPPGLMHFRGERKKKRNTRRGTKERSG